MIRFTKRKEKRPAPFLFSPKPFAFTFAFVFLHPTPNPLINAFKPTHCAGWVCLISHHSKTNNPWNAVHGLEGMQQNIDLRFLSAPTDLYPLLNKNTGSAQTVAYASGSENPSSPFSTSFPCLSVVNMSSASTFLPLRGKNALLLLKTFACASGL